MDKYEEKCRALLNCGRDQNGQFAEKKDCELSFFRKMFYYHKSELSSIYTQAILDQQQILKELKEVKDSLIAEKNHNKRLKKHLETIKKVKQITIKE